MWWEILRRGDKKFMRLKPVKCPQPGSKSGMRHTTQDFFKYCGPVVSMRLCTGRRTVR